MPDPHWCGVLTELKTVEVSQLHCSEKVIDVLFVQVVVLDRPVLGQGLLRARCRVFFDKVVDVPDVLCNGIPQVQFIDGCDVPVIMLGRYVAASRTISRLRMHVLRSALHLAD